MVLRSCAVLAVYFSQRSVPRRAKWSLRPTKQLEPKRSRNRFHWRTAQKYPTRNTAVKKRAGQGEADSGYLFADSSSSLFAFSTQPAKPARLSPDQSGCDQFSCERCWRFLSSFDTSG